LRNLPLQTTVEHSQADYAVASGRAITAALHYRNQGLAAKDRDRLARQASELSAEAANLELKSPISGTVLTPRPADHLGSYVTSGTDLVEVADLSRMRARIYVSEHDMYKVKVGARARLGVEGLLQKWDARAVGIAPVSTEIDPSLADQTRYKGLSPPNFYLADILVDNPDGQLKPGMRGTARVYGERRSVAGFGWLEIKNFVGRKVW
jgi:multidrug efflux pump subunit AcrA (membrane-fusion protein)